jgi:hypothetical protein
MIQPNSRPTPTASAAVMANQAKVRPASAAIDFCHRVDHREEHQRHRDHHDQGDVEVADRTEPGFRILAEGPAGQRTEHETQHHALPELDAEPPVEHARNPGKDRRTIPERRRGVSAIRATLRTW